MKRNNKVSKINHNYALVKVYFVLTLHIYSILLVVTFCLFKGNGNVSGWWEIHQIVQNRGQPDISSSIVQT